MSIGCDALVHSARTRGLARRRSAHRRNGCASHARQVCRGASLPSALDPACWSATFSGRGESPHRR